MGQVDRSMGRWLGQVRCEVDDVLELGEEDWYEDWIGVWVGLFLCGWVVDGVDLFDRGIDGLALDLFKELYKNLYTPHTFESQT